MIIEPKIRGFICTTAHPTGCATNVQRQIDHVVIKGPIPSERKRVLVLGCSTGYGLASRIVTTFGSGADTVGVSFEREPGETKPASAGWYNNRAFENRARAAGSKAVTIEGDAFSDAVKAQTIEAIRETLGQVDLIVYSLASPVRTDPKDGVTYRSAIKPYGSQVTSKTLNTGTGEVSEVTVEPATEEEAAATVKVMGGEDWELWIAALSEAGVLADNFVSLNYTYLGSELTWPIYHKGTLGKAKGDLDRAAAAIRATHGDNAAHVVALKAVVTQASSAIPVVPLYGTLLIKVEDEMGLGEGPIQQIDRLFRDKLQGTIVLDDDNRVRVDDWELSDAMQAELKKRWAVLNTENLADLADLPKYREEFMRLFGFSVGGVDYSKDVDPRVVD
ncbi:enoyl-[acyl-carrier protein] reductase/trans-2-enoyl-CoA reductase (NAD+) [Devosia subaequoris]|uniref:Enoyl-[acyl-carrier-protein] reductase [NADH] n=1 Tax=Devosia subaequoris TaxID=395930 RepID=A0A7W6NAZ7_9HYPH|nr:enoyl-ACP reductase FabV [Devosia subaequoris]MBB4052029.1 enoyl-[acyl-carrier protein] reductase/trans-2-enoyl-CoA reductase (NAD+) [Devosia subaequoris]MCP1210192.1 trans-2-enoyl-CoA reductase family protein [Devosia subaequoris]